MSDAYTTDFLVIGSGIAGLWFAHRVSRLGRVLIVTKNARAESATNLAQGGIASPISKFDSVDKHVADTLAAGDGLCHKVIVRKVVSMAPGVIRDLIDIGVQFTCRRAGHRLSDLDLGREGGHSERRIVHTADLTGREIERALIELVHTRSSVIIHENCLGIDLITVRNDQGRRVVRGAWVLSDRGDRAVPVLAPVVLLATGGAGQVYLHTTNPEIATGDGMAMAFRAGCRVGNMEFVQFHPTALALPGAERFLISEAVRGAGGVLRNAAGEAFMAGYHRQADLAPRDIVARAIYAEIRKSGVDHAFLDLTHLKASYIREHFPNITQRCAEFGLDITRQPIPVVPAAHYMCGGVVTDGRGRTDILGLFAAGEAAFTGMHGANRLASNSLLEAVCFAELAAKEAGRRPASPAHAYEHVRLRPPGGAQRETNSEEVRQKKQMLRETMAKYVGIVRTRAEIAQAKRTAHDIRRWADLQFVHSRPSGELIELRNLALVAELIATGAYRRTESRGLHFLHEKPRRDDARWMKDNFTEPRNR